MKQIQMTVIKDANGKDIFKLLSENPVEIPLTEDGGISKIKEMFNVLLNELIKDDVQVIFKKTPAYKNTLYENVCEEYVADLSTELANARLRLIEEELDEKPEETIEPESKSDASLHKDDQFTEK